MVAVSALALIQNVIDHYAMPDYLLPLTFPSFS